MPLPCHSKRAANISGHLTRSELEGKCSDGNGPELPVKGDWADQKLEKVNTH